MRHAKSDYPWGVADHDRPLNDRGRRDAPAAGRWLDGNVFWPAGSAPLVLVSSARRAQLTWSGVGEQLSERWSAAAVRDEPRIYEAPVPTLLDIVSETPDVISTVILVGHNPGLVDLIDRVCIRDAESATATQKFPTSAIAVLSTDHDWRIASDGGVRFTVTAFSIPRG